MKNIINYNWIDTVLSIAFVVAFAGLILALLGISGCSSQVELTREYASSDHVATQQKDAAIAQQPTLSGSCTSGCSFAYIDPRDRVQITGTDVMSTNETAATVWPSIFNFGMWAAGAWAATEIIDDITTHAGERITQTNNTVSGENNRISTGSRVSNQSSDGNYDGGLRTFNRTSEVNSVSDSYNRTAPATVVEQPPPVLVPTPLLVEP